MKKSIAILLTICCILSALVFAPASAEAAVELQSGAFKYKLQEDGTAIITGYTGKVTNLSIPNSLDGFTVTSIARSAFSGKPFLEFVAIPDTVTAIGERAFYYCQKLETVIVPDSVVHIDLEAFDRTPWKNKQPDGLLYIGKVAYQYIGDCPESVNIRTGTRYITDKAFFNCKGLKSISIPDSVTGIGARAFSSCSSLESLIIPDSVTELGDKAFDECDSLVHVDTGNGITSLSAFSFARNDALQSVIIGDSVKSIAGSKFCYCENLESVIIGDSVETIGSEAFYYCKNLSAVTFSDNTYEIGSYAFYGTSWWKNRPIGYIYAGKVACGYRFDDDHDYPEHIVLRDGTTGIAGKAFSNMYIKSLSMPDSVVCIGEEAFNSCYSLESVRFSFNLNSIRKNAFSATPWLNNQPDGIIYAGRMIYSFKGELPAEIVLDNGTVGMAYGAFYNCKSLKSITIPDSFTEISPYAFAYCMDLETVVIPVSVKNIEEAAFYMCSSIKDIYYAGSEKEWHNVSYPNPLIMSGPTSAYRDYTIHYGVVPEYSHDPIIVVPGIMGSRLFNSKERFDDSTALWDPPGKTNSEKIKKLKQLKAELAKDPKDQQLFVRPCENQNVDLTKSDADSTVDDFGREYGAKTSDQPKGVYQPLVDMLCETYSYRNTESYRPVYFFSYDWRNSNANSAEKLSEQIDDILKKTGAQKVDLVCHSMGGLVASKCYNDFSGSKINHIVTCATPYEGAPKLLNSVLNWDLLGEGLLDNALNDFALGVFGGLTAEVKASFAGVAELTPTLQYVSNIQMRSDGLIAFLLGNKKLSSSQYETVCKLIFGEKNYQNASDFQKGIRSPQNDLNVLYNYENAYFCVGINHRTICAMRFQLKENDAQRLHEDDISYEVLGDGTVPYYSATMQEKMTDLPQERWRQFDANHQEIVSYGKALVWIIDVLNDSSSSVISDPVKKKRQIKMRIACPVEVTVSKGTEYLCSDPNSFSSEASFGQLDIAGENDEIKILCLDYDPDYDVTLSATAYGKMDYSISFYDEDGKLIKTTSYSNVEVTPKTFAKPSTDINKQDGLWVNSDGETDIGILIPDPAESDPGSLIPGDVDGDGLVTIIDATAIQRHLAELPSAAYNESAADVDNDGVVTVMDATRIQRYLAELCNLDGTAPFRAS